MELYPQEDLRIESSDVKNASKDERSPQSQTAASFAQRLLVMATLGTAGALGAVGCASAPVKPPVATILDNPNESGQRPMKARGKMQALMKLTGYVSRLTHVPPGQINNVFVLRAVPVKPKKGEDYKGWFKATWKKKTAADFNNEEVQIEGGPIELPEESSTTAVVSPTESSEQNRIDKIIEDFPEEIPGVSERIRDKGFARSRAGNLARANLARELMRALNAEEKLVASHIKGMGIEQYEYGEDGVTVTAFIFLTKARTRNLINGILKRKIKSANPGSITKEERETKGEMQRMLREKRDQKGESSWTPKLRNRGGELTNRTSTPDKLKPTKKPNIEMGRVELKEREAAKVNLKEKKKKVDRVPFDGRSLTKLQTDGQKDFKRCLEYGLKANSSLNGKLEVLVTFNKKGDASISFEDGSTLRDKTTEKCIRKFIKKAWHVKGTNSNDPRQTVFSLNMSGK